MLIDRIARCPDKPEKVKFRLGNYATTVTPRVGSETLREVAVLVINIPLVWELCLWNEFRENDTAE